MRLFGRTKSCLLALFLIAATPACSALHAIISGESAAVDAVVNRAEKHLALGDYQKALDVYAAAYADLPRSALLRERYIGAGEQIKSAIDAAFQRQDFAEAGRSYTVLLKSGVLGKDFSRELSFDGESLNRRIRECSKGILETGLVQYREGKLDGAISVWKKVFVFDPDNKEVKNAIETATIQLQNLKNIR
jgi:tetratricopeptide (TPR) repeat protein